VTIRARSVGFVAVLFLAIAASSSAPAVSDLDRQIDDYVRLALIRDPQERRGAVEWLIANGGKGAVAPLIQLMRWMPEHRGKIGQGLAAITGGPADGDWFDWMVWQQDHPEFRPYEGFIGFAADTLALIDERFRRFVRADIPFEIRVEEIAWGGVPVDGIPALDNPATLAAADADYMNPDDLVFGVEINGDARAYPLRIMNWHEMANDVVGGVPVSLAYCTLCGAGILFDGRVAGRDSPFTFGSSGLLYRSNKLMYDRQTDSLWNQFTGRPVSGALYRSGIELTVLPLATTTWADWRLQHPDSKVLSIDTGYLRDYGPGVAYRDYFASPELMFPAALRSNQLQQKDIVFGLRVPGGVKAWPLAAFAQGTVFNDRVGFVDVVVFGNADRRTVRAYERRGRHFGPGSSEGELTEGDRRWTVTESALRGPEGETLPRLPGHLAYWFAWSGYFEGAPLGGN
jgi:hypothetical protein